MNSGETKDGYGHGIYEIQTFNPWNINRTYKHCIKQMSYIDLNFTDNQQPIIIPYHSMAFWMGHYKNEDTQNKTVEIAKALNSISTGVEYLYGTIKFKVFAVTCNRLIQTGTTNGYTYDFETSQNLILGTYDKDTYLFTYSAVEELGFNTHAHVDLWPAHNDTISKIEIPQKEAYTHIITFPKLHHKYMWDTQGHIYDKNWSLELCIPSNNNIKGILPNYTITNPTEMMMEDVKTPLNDKQQINITKTTIMNRNNYPLL